MDTCEVVVGAILAQASEHMIDLLLYFVTRIFNPVERETFAMVYVTKYFRHFLLGNQFTLFLSPCFVLLNQ